MISYNVRHKKKNNPLMIPVPLNLISAARDDIYWKKI